MGRPDIPIEAMAVLAVAEAPNLVCFDSLACRRFELHHVVAVTEEDASNGDGRNSICRRRTKLLAGHDRDRNDLDQCKSRRNFWPRLTSQRASSMHRFLTRQSRHRLPSWSPPTSLHASLRDRAGDRRKGGFACSMRRLVMRACSLPISGPAPRSCGKATTEGALHVLGRKLLAPCRLRSSHGTDDAMSLAGH